LGGKGAYGEWPRKKRDEYLQNKKKKGGPNERD